MVQVRERFEEFPGDLRKVVVFNSRLYVQITRSRGNRAKFKLSEDVEGVVGLGIGEMELSEQSLP